MTDEKKTDSITFMLPADMAKGKTARENEEVLHKYLTETRLEEASSFEGLHLKPTKFIGEEAVIEVAWTRDKNNIKAFSSMEKMSEMFSFMVDDGYLMEASKNYGGVKISSGASAGIER